jgi:hypothetical protein
MNPAGPDLDQATTSPRTPKIERLVITPCNAVWSWPVLSAARNGEDILFNERGRQLGRPHLIYFFDLVSTHCG